MSGLNVFSTGTPAYRVSILKAAAYTALITDELIQINGAYTVTLPPLNTLQGTTYHKKTYAIQNVSTTAVNVTIQPGTNTVTNVADTINSKAVWTVMPNETLVINGNEGDTNWTITSPTPIPALNRATFTIVVQTSGTTAVNVFDANGAPANIDITAVMVQVLTANSGICNVWQQGTSSIASITMTTAAPCLAGAIVGGTGALSNQAVAAGTAITVSCTSSAVANVIIIGTMQQYA